MEYEVRHSTVDAHVEVAVRIPKMELVACPRAMTAERWGELAQALMEVTETYLAGPYTHMQVAFGDGSPVVDAEVVDAVVVDEQEVRELPSGA